MIDLRRLRSFVAVAETLHFGRAAARLHISQPPLSRQIQQLEREIGTLLLRRNKRHVELTEAGAHLLVDARRMLTDVELMGERARRAALGAIGQLTLGFISAVDYSILPSVLRAFRETYPGVTLDLRELTSDIQLRDLRAERIDAGMLLAPVDDASLMTLPLLREPLVAALPAIDPLARRGRRVSLSALSTRPFILFPRSNAPGLHDMITDFCRSAGFAPRVAQEAIQMQTIVSLVSAGLGVALVPASLMDLRRPGVVYRPLHEPSPKMTVALAWRRDNRNVCVANFVATARRHARMAATTCRHRMS
jgi:DNA-binding transcriptional LysR family regulator